MFAGGALDDRIRCEPLIHRRHPLRRETGAATARPHSVKFHRVSHLIGHLWKKWSPTAGRLGFTGMGIIPQHAEKGLGARGSALWEQDRHGSGASRGRFGSLSLVSATLSLAFSRPTRSGFAVRVVISALPKAMAWQDARDSL